jgi:hypothetical protein
MPSIISSPAALSLRRFFFAFFAAIALSSKHQSGNALVLSLNHVKPRPPIIYPYEIFVLFFISFNVLLCFQFFLHPRATPLNQIS